MELTTLFFLILQSLSGSAVDVDALARDLATRDVVFLGEEHDSAPGHRQQLEIIRALARHTDRQIVISMEMFERDTQGVLDDYLQGRIDEKVFLEHSRPWPNYAEHYRPIVEWARERGTDVIAANAPRKLARRVSFRGIEALDDRRYLARTTTSPKDRYFDFFVDTMKGHVGLDQDGAMERMYAAQCLKDDTMAESIVDYFEARPYRRPLIVHLCGRFHSDYGLGTVVRVLNRRPLLNVGVVTMTATTEISLDKALEERNKAHYVLLVRKEAPASSLADRLAGVDGSEAALSEEATEEELVEVVEEEMVVEEPPVSTSVAPPADPTKREDNGRPAFGFMPTYDFEGGVKLDSIIPGGAASKAGLKDGDVIKSIDGQRLNDLEDYMDLMDTLRPGNKVKAIIIRGDKELSVEVTLGRRS